MHSDSAEGHVGGEVFRCIEGPAVSPIRRSQGSRAGECFFGWYREAPSSPYNTIPQRYEGSLGFVCRAPAPPLEAAGSELVVGGRVLGLLRQSLAHLLIPNLPRLSLSLPSRPLLVSPRTCVSRQRAPWPGRIFLPAPCSRLLIPHTNW